MENYNGDPLPLWFKARRYGWGWTPCSLEGWFVTIVSAVALLAGDLMLVLVANGSGAVLWRYGLLPHISAPGWAATVIGWNGVVLVPTLWICWKHGERPRWRWGDRGGSGPTPPDRPASS